MSEREIVEGDLSRDPETIPSREPNDCCPALESQLHQLTQTDDPPLVAEQLGFRVKDDKVQVLFVLAGEETGFLLDYGVELGSQSGNQVQGFAPFDQLCELANLDAVLAVRPAAQAVLP
ncbi:MAG: hypothetical protein R6X31_14245 [Anaerolineae bacterium]